MDSVERLLARDEICHVVGSTSQRDDLLECTVVSGMDLYAFVE